MHLGRMGNAHKNCCYDDNCDDDDDDYYYDKVQKMLVKRGW